MQPSLIVKAKSSCTVERGDTGVKGIKRIFRTLNRGKIILAMFGLLLLFQSAADAFTLLKPARSFYELQNEAPKGGEHVEGEVRLLLDYFASEQSRKEHKDGVTPWKTSAYYYLVPGGEGFFGVKLKDEFYDEASRLTEETLAYLLGGNEPVGGIAFTGKTVLMETEYPELVDSFRSYLLDIGFTEAEIDEMGAPVLAVPLSKSGVFGLFGVGAALTLISALWIGRDIHAVNKRAREKEEERAKENPLL